MGQVIETVGTTVQDSGGKPPQGEAGKARPIPTEDIPVYSVAKAAEWMRRPENEEKIRQFSKMAGQVTRETAQAIDREVTKTWRLFTEIMTDETVENDFMNAFLGTLVDE